MTVDVYSFLLSFKTPWYSSDINKTQTETLMSRSEPENSYGDNCFDNESETLDNRLTERIDTKLPLSLRCPGKRTCDQNTHTLNISGGGLQFVSNQMLEKDSDCTVQLNLSEQTKPLLFLARVVRSVPSRDGSYVSAVQFDLAHCDRDTFAQYSQFIAKQLLLKYLG